VAGKEPLTGKIVSDCNVAPVTVNVVEPLAGVVAFGSLIVAVTVLVPAEAPVICPAAIPKLATPGFPDDHVTMLLTSRVLPSVNVPMAESAVVVWFAIEGFAGTTATETMLEESTVNDALPLV